MHEEYIMIARIYREIEESSYVDDLGLTGEDKISQIKKCDEADEILEHANMKVHK